MKKTLKSLFKGYDKENDLIEFVASSDSIDRDGESIDPNGWDLSNVGKNLPLLWSHDAFSLPIGKVIKAWVEGNALKVSLEFAHKVNDRAKQVYEMVKAGFLNAGSVGFMPKTFDENGKMMTQELLEFSIVNVPANQDALRSNEYQAFIKSMKEFEDKSEKKEEIKSPMCRMTDESKDECKKRKIPEIMRENPDMKQEQAVAMASSMCEKECDEKEKQLDIKEGRVISEKNRNVIKSAIETIKQAHDALDDVLKLSEPAEREQPKEVKAILHKNVKRETGTDIVRDALRIIDKAAGAALREMKGGVKK